MSKKVYQVDYWLGPKHDTIYATGQEKDFSGIRFDRVREAVDRGNMVQILMVESTRPDPRG